jgi:small subunit ribosomal protein S3
MGKKVNPRIFRMGLSERWSSRWFAGRDFAELLKQDIFIRKFLKKELQEAGLDRVEIERSRGNITINISAAKPGLIIGRGGSGIEELKAKIQKKFLSKDFKLQVNITEVSVPNLSANVVLQSMKDDIEKRIPFRRVLKQTIEKVMKAGAKGVKVMVSGRLNGVEIARREKLVKGKVPLQTLRANIDYSRGVAATVYGAIGIKVWIYKGEYFSKKTEPENKIKPATKTVKLFSQEKLNIQPIEAKQARVKKVEKK